MIGIEMKISIIPHVRKHGTVIDTDLLTQTKRDLRTEIGK